MESETPVTDSLQKFSSTWLRAVNTKAGECVGGIHGEITWMTKGSKLKREQWELLVLALRWNLNLVQSSIILQNGFYLIYLN